MEVVNSIMNT